MDKKEKSGVVGMLGCGTSKAVVVLEEGDCRGYLAMVFLSGCEKPSKDEQFALQTMATAVKEVFGSLGLTPQSASLVKSETIENARERAVWVWGAQGKEGQLYFGLQPYVSLPAARFTPGRGPSVVPWSHKSSAASALAAVLQSYCSQFSPVTFSPLT